MSMTAWNLTAAIPTTKLHPPQLAGDTLHRSRLTQDLYDAALNHRLTLISAPAGAGKTTAVVTLHAAHPELPLAWAGLDEADDDPRAFLQLLIAAVQQPLPAFGRQVQQILDAGGDNLPNVLRLVAVLIGELAEENEDPLLVVLDDYHRVSDTTIHSSIDYLLERLPSHVHFILTTRHDPPLRLAQLRARGQMAEFRLEALSFSPAEVATLFREIMHLELSPEDLALIQERTAGWAAGLRLLTLSLPRLDSAERRSDLLQHLSRSHRLLFDYLIEEVLNGLTPGDRDFLLQTSILAELTPVLCNAVTERSDAAATLDALYRQNLFLVIGDTADPAAEPTYRYHALFAQFLQKQLRRRGDVDEATLHRRAADAAATPERRIHHLLAAQASAEAAEIIIAVGREQCQRDFISPQVLDWIERLPDEASPNSYWLDLIRASALKQKGQMARAWQLAREALGHAQAHDDMVGELEAIWILFHYITEDADPKWMARFESIVSRRPELLSPPRRASYLNGQAWQALNQYNWPAAQDRFSRYLDLAATARNEQVTYSAAQHIGPQWLFVADGMARIAAFDQATLQTFGEGDGLPQAGVYARQAWMYLLQGNLNAAEARAQRAGRIFNLLGSFAYMDLVVDWALIDIMLARSDFTRLAAFVAEAEQRLQQVETHRRNLPYYWCALWRAYWLQDDAAADSMQVKVASAIPEPVRERSAALAVQQGWQLAAAGKTVEAEARLRHAVRRYRTLPWIGTWGNPSLDLALFYLQRARRDDALAVWRETARDLQQRAMPGQALITGRKVIPLLELAVAEDAHAGVAQAALDAFGVTAAPQPTPIPGSSEALTPRETEVLHLLIEGASNQEIADRLTITKRTAKAHVSSILRKLQVSSRTEAVARAYELSLL